jgi:DNA-binding NarL/FixJ family response regulator
MHDQLANSAPHVTRQELGVLRLLACGLGTVAIAEQMGIAPRSVRNYISVLRRKTGCTERTQLVDWYRQRYNSNQPALPKDQPVA